MFQPGKIVKTFTSKSGKKIVIRYPQWEDLNQLTEYINKLSDEDTFTTFSGEKITKEEEGKTLGNWFLHMEKGDKIVLGCFCGNQLVGLSNIDRNASNRKRSLHVGRFAISVAKEFRNDGIGFELAKTIIDLAKKNINGLKMITLEVFSLNQKAINLYQKLGFKPYGVLKEGIYYQGNYVDEVKMVLTL